MRRLITVSRVALPDVASEGVDVLEDSLAAGSRAPDTSDFLMLGEFFKFFLSVFAFLGKSIAASGKRLVSSCAHNLMSHFDSLELVCGSHSMGLSKSLISSLGHCLATFGKRLEPVCSNDATSLDEVWGSADAIGIDAFCYEVIDELGDWVRFAAIVQSQLVSVPYYRDSELRSLMRR